jgi:hypothetical protein
VLRPIARAPLLRRHYRDSVPRRRLRIGGCPSRAHNPSRPKGPCPGRCHCRSTPARRIPWASRRRARTRNIHTNRPVECRH